MRIKPDNIEFISFNDGICDIYTIDDEEKRTNKYIGLNFSNKVLGFKRYWAAAANQMQINRVMKVPFVNGIDTFDTVEVNGVGKYDIKAIQEIYDSNPPCLILTLKIQ